MYEYVAPGVAPPTVKLAVLVVSGSANVFAALIAATPAPVNTGVRPAPPAALRTVIASVAAVAPYVTRKYGATDN